jgi:hypothetical protein
MFARVVGVTVVAGVVGVVGVTGVTRVTGVTGVAGVAGVAWVAGVVGVVGVSCLSHLFCFLISGLCRTKRVVRRVTSFSHNWHKASRTEKVCILSRQTSA